MSQATTAIVANPTNTIVDLCRRGIGAMLSMEAGLRVVLTGCRKLSARQAAPRSASETKIGSNWAPKLTSRVNLADNRKPPFRNDRNWPD